MSESFEGDNSSRPDSPSAQQHQIPKYRLDEEIQKNRQLEGELNTVKGTVQTLQQMVAQFAGQRQQPEEPEVDPPHLQELKESNPAVYQMLKEQDLKLKRLSAANFQAAERADRAEFQHMVGPEEAQRVGQFIEQKLEEQRRQGHFHMNRSQLYQFLVGAELIERKRRGGGGKQRQDPQAAAQGGQPASGQGSNPPPAPPEQQNPEEDLPPTDPSLANSAVNGAASGGGGEPSLEELERRLIGKTF